MTNTTQLAGFLPHDVLSALFNNLTEREKDIITRRFGLLGREIETLEKIGNSYSITRERVRQIENMILKDIKHSETYKQVLQPVEETIIEMINGHGSVMAEHFLLQNLIDTIGTTEKEKEHYKNFYFLLLTLESKLLKFGETFKHKRSWGSKQASLQLLTAVVDELTDVMKKSKKPLTFEELSNHFQNTDLYDKYNEKLSEKAILSYLHVSKHVAKNQLGLWGLKKWNVISPKSMTDKIYLSLKHLKKPSHFKDIAKVINDLKLGKKKVQPQTVHNELIKSDKFVLVGRGIYALTDWGFKPGTVKDVIKDALKNSETGLTLEEIKDLVLKQRMVKPTTISIALSDKKLFKKMGDKYTIAA